MPVSPGTTTPPAAYRGPPPARCLPGVYQYRREREKANRLVEVLPALADAAARGLAGSNLTILNGTQGVNEVVAGLVGQGLSILDALKNSASVNGVATGAVTGTVASPGPMTAAASTPSIEAD